MHNIYDTFSYVSIKAHINVIKNDEFPKFFAFFNPPTAVRVRRTGVRIRRNMPVFDTCRKTNSRIAEKSRFLYIPFA